MSSLQLLRPYLGQLGPATEAACPGLEVAWQQRCGLSACPPKAPPPSPCSLHGFLNSQSRYVKAKHNYFFLPSEFFIELKLE